MRNKDILENYSYFEYYELAVATCMRCALSHLVSEVGSFGLIVLTKEQ